MANNIVNIRQELSEQVGKEVKLTAYESRNRVVEHTGVLSNTYPSIFVIDLDSEEFNNYSLEDQMILEEVACRISKLF